MQFVSLEFLGFLLALGALHWLVPSRRGRNAVLLLGSLGFAATFRWWAPLVLLGAATFEWSVARALGRSDDPKQRLHLLWTSIIANGFLLFFFRYNHFFAPELSVAFRALGLGTGTVPVLSMVGASFWTLQKATLTLDTYAQRRTGDPDWLETMVFVSFFPNLVSGPIERSRDFIPQLQRDRHLTSRLVAEAGWLFAIGTFKKVVVSDNIGRAVEDIFGSHASGLAVVIGIWAYAVQIWTDFSGYSDMARSVAKLMGIELTENFDSPYEATNISDFWKRWHISFSSWLNENIFVPVSFLVRDLGDLGIVLATWATFLFSGLWHGNGWNYVAWGAVHATGLTIFLLTRKKRKKWKKQHGDPLWVRVLATFATFNLVCLGYIFFRAATLTDALGTLGAMVRGPIWPESLSPDWTAILLGTAALVALHWVQLRRKDVFWVFQLGVWPRTILYLLLGFLILRFYAPAESFIYFQF